MDHVTWGLDVSTNKKKTAAVALDWSTPGVARLSKVVWPLQSEEIADLIREHQPSTWAVDVPFGWPDKFVGLMCRRHNGPLPPSDIPPREDRESWRTREVAQRVTDRFLTDDERIQVRPLPASFQLLGATAAMWTLVEAELAAGGVAIDRAGLDGLVCETYPAAALSAWGLDRKKQTWPQLRSNFPFLRENGTDTKTLGSDDVCDAVVCALVARARDLQLTIGPSPADLPLARREGWIHVSCDDRCRLPTPMPDTSG